MNSAHAFTYAMSGSYTDTQMQRYSQYVHQSAAAFKGAGGWLARQADKALDSFNTFFNSRAWELSKRLTTQSEGDYVGQFDIGYLGTPTGLQGARGFMRDFIMAHPGMQQDYLDGKTEGYGGEFNKLCTGIGEANPFYRRARHGVLTFNTVDDKRVLKHAHYHECFGNALSFRSRNDLDKTYIAIDYHRAKGLFDIASPDNNPLGGAKQEVQE